MAGLPDVLPARAQPARPPRAASLPQTWFLRAAVLGVAAGLVLLFFAVSPVARTLSSESEIVPAAPAASAPAAHIPTPTPWYGPRAARALDLRVGPSEDYMVLGVVPGGARLRVVGVSEDGQWLAVSVAPGSALYAWLPLAEVLDAPPLASLPVKPVRLIPLSP